MVGTGLASEQQRGSGSNERAPGPRPFHTRGAPLSFPYRLPHVSRKSDREQNWYIDHTRRRRERGRNLSQNQKRERGKKAGWATGRSSARKSVGCDVKAQRRRERERVGRMRSREGERGWKSGGRPLSGGRGGRRSLLQGFGTSTSPKSKSQQETVLRVRTATYDVGNDGGRRALRLVVPDGTLQKYEAGEIRSDRQREARA